MREGQIIKILSKEFIVDVGKELLTCRIRGLFRNLKMTPLVGDFVTIDKDLRITKIHPRKNEIKRPNVANIEYAFIVMSVTEPNFDFNLLDKLISQMRLNHIVPAIIVTKTDIARVSVVKKLLNDLKYYEALGYRVFESTRLNEIKNFIDDKTIVLAGQTGAGKSSFINKLVPSHNLKTSEISKVLGRGRHTTRNAEILEVFGGRLIDTPGFSSLNFKGLKAIDIRDSFVEFKNHNCKFQDCMHENTDDCDIAKRAKSDKILNSRLENYRKILKENR